MLLRQQLAESMENAAAYRGVKDAMEQKAASLVSLAFQCQGYIAAMVLLNSSLGRDSNFR